MQIAEKGSRRVLKLQQKNFLLQRMRDKEEAEMNSLREQQNQEHHQQQEDSYESSWD